MRAPDIELAPVQFGNPNDTQNFAGYNAKLVDLLRDIYDHLQRVKILTVAPTAKELAEFLNESDIVILHSVTQANRRLYYRYQGTVYVIASA